MNTDKTFTALLEQLLHRPDLFSHPERLTEIISESNVFRGDERRTPVKLSAEQLSDAEAAQRRLDFVAPPSTAPNVTTTPWSLFEKIGVGLPEREALLVDASIVKLSQQLTEKGGVTSLRFFGKVYGASQNYYIVEGERVANVVEQFATKPPRKGLKPPTQPEPEGKGVNRYIYWVSTNPVDEWTQLPDVTPQQITTARLIKKLFSGDLEAPVSSYPIFPGVEKHFLRAQIARLAAATQISPNSALKLFEEEEEDEEPEEEEDENAPRKPKVEKYRPLTVRNDEWGGPEEGEDPKDLALWTHHYSIIDKLGRTTKVPQQEATEEEEEEQADEEEEQKEEEEEEEIQLLRTLDQDKPVYEPPEKPEAEEEEPEEEPEEEVEEVDEEQLAAEKAKKTIQSWVSRATNNIFKRHAVVFLRSARWPGAYAVSAEGGKRWGTLYVGDGVKYAYHAFTPSLLQLEVEAPTLTEKSDPTPLTEKRMLQGEEVPEDDKIEEEQEEEEEEAE